MTEITKQFYTNLEKIKAFVNTEVIHDSISSVLLFKEYQKRMIKWRIALGQSPILPRTKDGQNLFSLLSIKNEEPFIDIDEFRVNDLIDTNFGKSKFWSFDYLSIYWEIFKDDESIKKYDLPHPYEPVIKLIKRGGRISMTTDHYFTISSIEVSKRKKYYNYNLPSIADDFLGYIDDKCGDKAVNIPNQKEIDLLWRQFNTDEELYQRRYN